MIEMEETWSPFDGGRTVMSRGVEGGITIYDEEHSYGARISLEKDYDSAPYAITFGIYGTMFHTHFEGDLKQCQLYIARTKDLIAQVFKLAEIKEENRNDDWNSAFNDLMQKLVS